MTQEVPSRWAVSKSLLLTCIFSFIVSSIPLAYVIFIHNPHIMKEMKEQAESTCVAPEIPADVLNEKVAEATAVVVAQRDELVKELGRYQTINIELQKQIDESKKEFTPSDLRKQQSNRQSSSSSCEIELARATSGFEESYRRFEIVRGYFDRCKNQTSMLGKVLIDAEKEIKNLSKQLTRCNIINNKMEGERRMEESKNNPQQYNRTTTATM